MRQAPSNHVGGRRMTELGHKEMTARARLDSWATTSTKQTTGKGLRRSTTRWGQLAAACVRTRARASTWLCLRCVRPARRDAREEHRRRVHGGSWVHSGDSRDVRTPGQRAEATWPARSRRVRRARHGDDVARPKFISFKPFRNCKTPKIFNKLENLQKQKL
jgi:hypothetical protein